MHTFVGSKVWWYCDQETAPFVWFFCANVQFIGDPKDDPVTIFVSGSAREMDIRRGSNTKSDILLEVANDLKAETERVGITIYRGDVLTHLAEAYETAERPKELEK